MCAGQRPLQCGLKGEGGRGEASKDRTPWPGRELHTFLSTMNSKAAVYSALCPIGDAALHGTGQHCCSLALPRARVGLSMDLVLLFQ